MIAVEGSARASALTLLASIAAGTTDDVRSLAEAAAGLIEKHWPAVDHDELRVDLQEAFDDVCDAFDAGEAWGPKAQAVQSLIERVRVPAAAELVDDGVPPTAWETGVLFPLAGGGYADPAHVMAIQRRTDTVLLRLRGPDSANGGAWMPTTYTDVDEYLQAFRDAAAKRRLLTVMNGDMRPTTGRE